MQLLTAEQIAKQLQVSKLRVYEMARLGMIPCIRLGRTIRFDESSIHEWLAQGGSKEKRMRNEKLFGGEEV